jgi:RimJ/RimL family protein N-acetyltransferase
MGFEVQADAILAFWTALRLPEPKRSPRFSESLLTRIVREGWVGRTEVEDLLVDQDPRLSRELLPAVVSLAEALRLPWRYVYPTPRMVDEDPYGFEMLHVTDLAALLVTLERIGFRIDATELCDRLAPVIEASSHNTGEALGVLTYARRRHRQPSLTLRSNNEGAWARVRPEKHRTAAGYRVEFMADEDGRPRWLSTSAPKFRAKPQPQSHTCDVCGMTYMKGYAPDSRLHRSHHAAHLAILKPKPDKTYLAARRRDPDAAWVDYRSPMWKRRAILGRALLFKREFKYDFLQWSENAQHDIDAVGYLFADEDGRIVGACAFRPQDEPGGRWRLDWIWLCPTARRQGHLSRAWPRFVERFGEFDVEHPLSPAMKSYLRGQGLAHLIAGEATALPEVA